MNTTVALNLPIRRVLFGDVGEEESTATLEGRLAPDTVDELLTGASTALRGAARGEVGRAIDGVLSMNAIDALAMGWRKHRLLTKAAHRTVASPGSQEVVELASHRITASYQPRVDVFVDDMKVGQIDLSLKLTANVVGLCGVVKGGRLMALRSGHVDLAAILRCQGLDLAVGERRVDMTAEVSLGEGVRLINEPGSKGVGS